MLPLNLNHFTATKSEYLKLPKMSPDILKIIEDELNVTIATKIEILQIFNGDKWVTEIEYDEKSLDEIIAFLDKIGLPFYAESYSNLEWLQIKEHKFKNYNWLQVGANQAILEYLKSRKQHLTEIEAGILYGYPVSAVLAFSGLIDIGNHPKTDVAGLIGSGVPSQDFKKEEADYCNEKWIKIQNLSSKLAKEAEEYYSQFINN